MARKTRPPTLEELARAADSSSGLKCRRCGCQNFRVTNTYPSGPRNSIRRRRQCRNCGEILQTFERGA